MEFDDLASWRQQLAERMLLLTVVIMPVATAVTVPYIIEQEIYGLLYFDAGLWSWLMLLLAVRKRPIVPTAAALVFTVFTVSTLFHLILGPEGARPIWLTISVAAAAALYGMRGVLILTAANVVMLTLAHTFIPPSYAPWQEALALSLPERVMTLFNSSCLIFIIGAAIATMLEGLGRQLAETKKSQENYRLLADNVSDVIWTMDTTLRMTYLSPSFEQLRGYTVEEGMAQTLREMVVPDSYNEIMAGFTRQMQLIIDGDPKAWAPLSFEAQQPCKDGTTVFTRNHVKIIPGDDGKPGMIVGVSYDITGRKQVEADRKQLQEQLHRSQKLEAIGRLAGGVAHDFNNVLTVIAGNAALTLSQLGDDHAVRAPVQQIENASERAADLTRQLLAFSRKQIIEPKVIDFGDLIEGLHRMLLRLIGEDVILRSIPQDLAARVRIDPTQAEQIVFNLAVNGRDAMPDGGELVIETTIVELDEAYCEGHPNATPGDYVMLSVSDTGVGMSAETCSKIFEPFFTTKALGKGTGLGLATVYGVVEQNGGIIEVYSEPGLGTTFKVYFPRVFDKAEEILRPVYSEPVGGRETILVVEDAEMVRTLAERILDHYGYQVLVADSARDALQLAEQHDGPIDLLLTDVVMPHVSGRELAAQLTDVRPDIKVLFTSGYSQNIIARHGVLDEGLHLITKPYSLQSLASRVREVLDS